MGKLVLGLLLFFCIAMVLGGILGIADETYPAAIPGETHLGSPAVEGDPSALIIFAGIVVVGLWLGSLGNK
jgi:hypothetical protein